MYIYIYVSVYIYVYIYIGFTTIEASADSNPLIRSMLDCVSRVLEGKSLYFLSSTDNRDNSYDTVPLRLTVPAVIYESSAASNNTDTGYEGTHDSYDLESDPDDTVPRKDGIGRQSVRVISSEDVTAVIGEGDVLLLPSVKLGIYVCIYMYKCII
jgi:hypothetical protein